MITLFLPLPLVFRLGSARCQRSRGQGKARWRAWRACCRANDARVLQQEQLAKAEKQAEKQADGEQRWFDALRDALLGHAQEWGLLEDAPDVCELIRRVRAEEHLAKAKKQADGWQRCLDALRATWWHAQESGLDSADVCELLLHVLAAKQQQQQGREGRKTGRLRLMIVCPVLIAFGATCRSSGERVVNRAYFSSQIVGLLSLSTLLAARSTICSW